MATSHSFLPEGHRPPQRGEHLGAAHERAEFHRNRARDRSFDFWHDRSLLRRLFPRATASGLRGLRDDVVGRGVTEDRKTSWRALSLPFGNTAVARVPASGESASKAGLRYVSDSTPGFRRRRRGKGFVYFDSGGRRVHDPREVARIGRIVIPPAWSAVWICPYANGHLQAVGRDARGRKQYRYHPRWSAVRDETKYDRLAAFAAALPKIRRRVQRDLRRRGLPRRKVLATVVELLERTQIRIGNAEYARDNGSYGLTTLCSRHVRVSAKRLRFRFRGKSGQPRQVEISDARLARIVRRCQEIPGQELFQYLDEHGEVRSIRSEDVNAYLREICGADFTAKDFRTWAGSVRTIAALLRLGVPRTRSQARRNLVRAIAEAAVHLGNTPAVCRRSYVHPRVLDSYLEHRTAEPTGGRPSPPARVKGEGRSTPRRAAGLDRQEMATLEVITRGGCRQQRSSRRGA
jgi:DNA topoisomerase-1